MDLLTAIKEIKEASLNYGLKLTEAQKEVLNCKNEYTTVYYGGFPNRQLGRSIALVLKALRLSEQENKTIYISGHSSYLFEQIMCILRNNNMMERVAELRNISNDYSITFTNGSNIRVKKMNSSNYRGVSCDYVLLDDIRIRKDEQHIESAVYSVISKNGQVFAFLFEEVL